MDDTELAILATEELRDSQRSVSAENLAWFVGFAVLIGAVVGGLVVRSLNSRGTDRAAVAATTARPVTTGTALATTTVRNTVTRVSYVASYVPPKSARPSPDATGDPVLSALNEARAQKLTLSGALTSAAQRCAQADAAANARNVCPGAAWSAVFSGDSVSAPAFAQTVIRQPDGAWLRSTFRYAGVGSATGADGRVFWALVLG